MNAFAPTSLPGNPENHQFMSPKRIPDSESTEWWDNFKQLLENNYEWPGEYLFKFIVPKESVEELKAVFEGQEIDVKASSKGKYHSVTSRILCQTSDEVISYYKNAGTIDGVISL